MEQQVSEAALAMIRPTTNSATRSAASNFLEQWTRTPEAWGVYVQWVQSFGHGDENNPEVLGMHLLCLTLLQAKIRREVSREGSEKIPVEALRNEIWSRLQKPNHHSQMIGPLCGCMAALSARDGNLSNLVQIACQSGTNNGNNGNNGNTLNPMVSLRLLASLPPEVESCGELTIPQVTAELWPHIEGVLDTVRQALTTKEETAIPALEALRNWAQTCHVSLSHLNSPTCGGTEKLLPALVRLLSQPRPTQEELLISASRALTEAIMVPSDNCTPSREAAVEAMIGAIAQEGFVAAPFAFCTSHRWDDAAHALATMLCTLVNEEIDELSEKPSEACLSLLLMIQSHPHIPVALTVLECWLTTQEVPTAARHENWKAPLFLKVTEGLVRRISYTKSFTTWQDELDLDPQDFSELRRMVTDVLVSCYFLLRVQYLQQMAAAISSAVSSGDWALIEAALFCLGCVAREVCARVKARGNSESLTADRDATAQQLLRLVDQLCGGPNPKAAAEAAAAQHPLILTAVSNFVGYFSPAWNVHCSPEAIIQLLVYLRAALGVSSVAEDAAKATKSVYVGCVSQLLKSPVLTSCTRETMEVVLSTDHEAAMCAVAEGSTRLIVQIKDAKQMIQSLHSILEPLVKRIEQALKASSATAGQQPVYQIELAVEALAKYLHVLRVVIQFCDTTGSGVPSPLGEVVHSVWPFLDQATRQCGSYDTVLNEVVAIHKQVLSNSSEIVAPRFSETVKFIVEAFDKTKHPSTLEYLAAAVEIFSPMNDDNINSFNQLLAHVTRILGTHITTVKRPDECPQLICAYFEMNQRFVLFCPLALVKCSDFGNIVDLAVECLTACKGERESTRATLNFLAQLFGWRSIRLSPTAASSLETVASVVDEQLAKHGENITRICIGGLAGGSPQMLWPSLTDCVLAIVTHVVGSNASSPVVEESTVAHQWVYDALTNCQTQKPVAPETFQQIMAILFHLVRQGPKQKPKAKMLLTDFAKLCKGEMGVDALLTYSL